MRICKKITAFISAMLIVCTMSVIQVSSTAITQIRSYVKKTLDAGGDPTSTSTYSLSLSTDNNGSPSPRFIMGPDDRYRDTNSSVVRLSYDTIKFSMTSSRIATGFIINENTIVTAAHCLYNTDTPTIQVI